MTDRNNLSSPLPDEARALLAIKGPSHHAQPRQLLSRLLLTYDMPDVPNWFPSELARLYRATVFLAAGSHFLDDAILNGSPRFFMSAVSAAAGLREGVLLATESASPGRLPALQLEYGWAAFRAGRPVLLGGRQFCTPLEAALWQVKETLSAFAGAINSDVLWDIVVESMTRWDVDFVRLAVQAMKAAADGHTGRRELDGVRKTYLMMAPHRPQHPSYLASEARADMAKLALSQPPAQARQPKLIGHDSPPAGDADKSLGRGRLRSHLQGIADLFDEWTKGGAPAEDVSVDEIDLVILRTLLRRKPRRLSYDMISDFSNDGVSRRTVAERIPWLVSAGLAHQPKGERGGTTITAKGEVLLGSLGS
jgi:hypothetical protein